MVLLCVWIVLEGNPNGPPLELPMVIGAGRGYLLGCCASVSNLRSAVQVGAHALALGAMHLSLFNGSCALVPDGVI